MTAPFLPAGFRATDADDNPLAGGYYKFYIAQTTTPKAVYSDADFSTSLGTTVNLNSAGAPVSGANTPVLIYLDTGDYKAELYDADDTLLFMFDDIPGYVEPPAASSSGLPETPVISKTSNYTVTTDDRGKLIKCDPTGGSFQITLPSAASAGDGFRVGFTHTGTTGAVTLVADTGQFIRGQAVSTGLALIGRGETIWLVSDAADWIQDVYAPPHMKGSAPFITIKGRSSTPPLSPEPGERWIVQGVLTGAWSTLGFTADQIVECDGKTPPSWFAYSPGPGWQAYDIAFEQQLQYRGTEWVTIPDVVDPGETTLRTAVFDHQVTNGSNGGTATANAWTKRTLNTTVENDIPDCSITDSVITLAVGKYFIDFSQFLRSANDTGAPNAGHNSRIKVITGTATPDPIKAIAGHNTVDLTSSSSQFWNGSFPFHGAGILTVEATATIQLQYFHDEGGSSSTELGLPCGEPDAGPEIYARVTIIDLRVIQGATGTQGPAGSVLFSNGGELTIASGVITATGTKHTVDTESDASTDDLDTIDGGSDGMMVILRAAHDARTVVLKNGTGNLAIGGDITLDTETKTALIVYDEGLAKWIKAPS